MAWPVRKATNATSTSIKVVNRGTILSFRSDSRAVEDAAFKAGLARNDDDTQADVQGTGLDAATKKKVHELEAKCKAQAKAVQESKSMCQKMAATIQQHEAHKAAMEKRCLSLEASEEAMRRKIAREQKRISKVEEEHGMRMEEVRVEKERFRKALLEANAEKAKANERVAALELEVEALKQQLLYNLEALPAPKENLEA